MQKMLLIISKILILLKILMIELFIIVICGNVFFIYIFLKNHIELENQKCQYIKPEIITKKIELEDSDITIATNNPNFVRRNLLLEYEKKNYDLLSNYLNYKVQNKSYVPYEVKIVYDSNIKNYYPAISTIPTYFEYTNAINELLYNSFHYWPIELKFKNFDLHKRDGRYLSIDAYYELDNYNLNGKIYTTVDMQKQKIVYLNDLVEIDSEFVDIITSTGVLKNYSFEYFTEVDVFTKNNNYEKRLKNSEVYRKETILFNLKRCSIPYNGGNYYRKPAFYLSDGRLYFYNAIYDTEYLPPTDVRWYHSKYEEFYDYCSTKENMNYTTYVELEDIESKLKVEKW